MRRPTLADALAAIWTARVLRIARARLRSGELRAIALQPPRRRALAGRRGVKAVLWLGRASCLEGALVRQRFEAGRGVARDVVIGVGRPAERFGAHAWLDGERDGERFGFRELTRVPLVSEPRAAAAQPPRRRPSGEDVRTRGPAAS
jgi:hypothetical protein